MNRPPAARRRAYTLLEVMIAITLFALVVAAIYACWSAVLRGSRGGLDAAADVQRGRVAQQSLEDSLTTVQLVPENLHFYAFYGGPEYLSFVARLPLSFPGSGIFGDQVMRRVTFSLEAGRDNSTDLVMTQMPHLMAETADQEPYSLTLAKHVSLLAFQYWSSNQNAGAVTGQGEWLDEWPFTNRLPTKIRYALGFDSAKKEVGAAPYVVNSVVYLPAVAVPDRQAAASGGGVPQPGGGERPGAPGGVTDGGALRGRGGRPGGSAPSRDAGGIGGVPKR